LDELLVACHFGSHAVLESILQKSIPAINPSVASIETAIKWARDPGCIKILLRNENVRKKFWETYGLGEIMKKWSSAIGTRAQRDLEDVLELCFEQLFREDALADLLRWSNYILCSAAEAGCLPAVKLLLTKSAASGDQRIIRALIADHREKQVRQSIGGAVYNRHLDVLEYLVTQTYVDIKSHLTHCSPEGEHVLHWATLRHSSPEVYRILLKHVPLSLVNKPSNNGTTPLEQLVFTSPDSVETVRVLLDEGKADPNLMYPSEASYSLPLRVAVRRGAVRMCQILIDFGANADEALETDNDGKPELKDENPEEVDATKREQILELLVKARA
jgi:hypothetical protein